ncbi:leucine rich repeat family protein [Stylonychia lemnae]|uniref:Leucine rich repeat family protein n=1 Tax=Stylonychia lemnae TaxID=5949 RepID=A0A078AAB1_STYLE|nr:leucine rich repeat family protein [Stylonychia lemnae]|eukprot:CDW78522.1 leucine rich repeat family protein [Stylonychia lemnae]
MAEQEEKLVLKPEVIKKYLTTFDYTPDRESMQFLHLILANKRIEALNNSILEAKHVTFLDLQNNNIVDVNIVSQLTGLVKLNLAKNKIKSINLFTNEENFTSLKWLDISNNKYTELVGIKCPKLEYLDISYNRLEKVSEGWTGHGNIRILKSIDNKFKNLQTFKEMGKLEELYLESNVIASLTGYENLPSLRKLHLRKNKIEKIEDELPPLDSLQYLNLRSNKVPNLEHLAKLFVYPQLRDINVLSCPIERNASSLNLLIAEVLILNPKIKRFCKTEITDQNKLEAVYLAKFRWTKEQEAKKAEEEKKRLEGEQAEDN